MHMWSLKAKIFTEFHHEVQTAFDSNCFTNLQSRLFCTWTRFPSKGRLLRSDSGNDYAAGYFLDYSM